MTFSARLEKRIITAEAKVTHLTEMVRLLERGNARWAKRCAELERQLEERGLPPRGKKRKLRASTGGDAPASIGEAP